MTVPRYPHHEIVSALEQAAMNGIPGRYGARILDVGTSAFIEYFREEVFQDLVRRGGSTVRFLEGAYGAGKTHVLSLLRDRGLADGMIVVETELSADLSLEEWQSITKHILANAQAEIDGRSYRSLPRILDAAASAGKLQTQNLSRIRVVHPGFREAVRQYTNGHQSRGRRLLRDYLLGEKVGAGQLKEVGVRGVKNPLSARNAEAVLRSVTALLQGLGFPGTLLLFDENERTFEIRGAVPTQRIRRAANLMRRLIDACTTGSLTGTAAVFAVLPGFLQRCSEAYAALGQRLYAPGALGGSWRSPVLNVGAVTTISTPDAFLEACIDRFCALVQDSGVSVSGLRSLLRQRGKAVLEANAGSGYRRPLIRAHATAVLEVLEGV